MIEKNKIQNIISEYNDVKICVLGSHSALEIMDGAKDEKLKTIVICKKGREKTYERFSRIVDKMIILDKFEKILTQQIQKKLLDMNAVLIPHRALTAYLGYDNIENKIYIPIFGNRKLFKAEDRTIKKNQYYLLEKANIKHPKIFNEPKKIDRPSIVKVQEKKRSLERAFFMVNSYPDYKKQSQNKIIDNTIAKEDLDNASIEEIVVGTYMNFNYFSTPISKKVDFIGIERRLQTNLFDYNSYPAKQQIAMNIDLQNIEVGHTPATIRESLLEKVISMGDDFVDVVKKIYPPGIIGPFSLQSVITKDLEIFVYDVSLRVPGSPIISTTSPYTKYQYGKTFGVGRRIAMEIKDALKNNNLDKIVT
ncbi:MAG: formate--phosphoribosylaminoimidazolecarboxamide ligase family protein [Thaumarchaeota archaeon]|nr:formate--phosphoribosylaminoimidazolecarboxamide ligase family protein [Nitrososphaerota archaeon]MCY3975569.1 formate--phosphoribosylaminoimidazolecarboxamide ligase family protein [Nitrososphaerota archaeon]